MYPGPYARQFADRPAFIMASSGQSLTYAQLEARSNQLAHLLRAQGLQRLGHYAVFMENNAHYLEACVAGERSGLYYTCVNGYLQADELAYILNNSESTLLITSADKLAVAREALAQCPNVVLCLVVPACLAGCNGGSTPPETGSTTEPSQATRAQDRQERRRVRHRRYRVAAEGSAFEVQENRQGRCRRRTRKGVLDRRARRQMAVQAHWPQGR